MKKAKTGTSFPSLLSFPLPKCRLRKKDEAHINIIVIARPTKAPPCMSPHTMYPIRADTATVRAYGS